MFKLVFADQWYFFPKDEGGKKIKTSTVKNSALPFVTFQRRRDNFTWKPNNKHNTVLIFIEKLSHENVILITCFVSGWTELYDFICLKKPCISFVSEFLQAQAHKCINNL